MQVGIVGVGHVGASIAISLLQGGVVRHLLLHDRDAARAEGEAMDLAHGAPFYPRASVQAATLAEIVACDVVVFAAGRNSRPGETRLQLLADNVRVAAQVGRALAGSSAVVVAVSNPVDVLTRVLQQASGLPPSRVLGTGTMLDTARLRQRLGERLGMDARSVHAQVLGEHGDSEFVQWSQAQVGGAPLRARPEWTVAGEQSLADEVRHAAYEIIRRKGVTNHAIGLVAADLVRAIVRDEHRVLTVSRCQDAPGLHGVALSLPAVVGRGGAGLALQVALDEAEAQALQASADVLQQAWAGWAPAADQRAAADAPGST
jgi:L-lactate dehydrogenase